MKLHEFIDLIDKGDTKTALEKLDEIQDVDKNTKSLFKAELYQISGDFEESILTLKSLNHDDNLDNFAKFAILSLFASAYMWTGKKNKMVDSIDNASKLIHKLETNEEGNYWFSHYYNLNGLKLHFDGNNKDALDQFNSSLKYAKEINNPRAISRAMDNIGIVYQFLGEIDKSIEFHLSCLEIRKKLENEHLVARSLANLGECWAIKGEFDKSLDYYNLSVPIFDQKNIKEELAMIYNDIGIINFEQDDLPKAYDHFAKSYNIRKAIGNDIFTSYSLYCLVMLSLSLNLNDLTMEYFTDLEVIALKSENKYVNLRKRICESKILSLSTSLEDNAKAKEILTTIIGEKSINLSLTTNAILLLTSLLLEELMKKPDEELLEEITVLSDKISNIAQKKGSIELEIQLLFIKSKLNLLSNDIDSAKSYLNKAISLAKEKGMNKLLDEAVDQSIIWVDYYDKWDSLPMNKKIEESEVIKLINKTFFSLLKDN